MDLHRRPRSTRPTHRQPECGRVAAWRRAYAVRAAAGLCRVFWAVGVVQPRAVGLRCVCVCVRCAVCAGLLCCALGGCASGGCAVPAVCRVSMCPVVLSLLSSEGSAEGSV